MPESRCRNGHLALRRTRGGACTECVRQHMNFYETGEYLSASSSEEISLSVRTSVYVVSAGEFVKVGIAEHPQNRISTIQTHCPLLVKIEYVSEPMPRLNARRIEQKCFTGLFGSHVQGEWYRCDAAEVIALIESMAPPTTKDEPIQLRLVS